MNTLVSTVLYADDIALPAETFASAQRSTQVAADFAEEHHFSYGLAKCGVTSASGTDPELLLGEAGAVPKVAVYKYLGVMFNAEGLDVENISRLRAEKVLALTH